ncbi:hypothetical protein [Desulfogranum japonicum]|uniref:hypothetical protein n=1 Tax=Desulfogranum japonicum TaxID=231447 RepID=UPI0004917055|nr:hypothetical protein [Desulfogranum japonicum]
MNLSLSPYSLPELQGIKKEEQKRLWQKCAARSWHHWQTWVASIVCLSVIVGLGRIAFEIASIYPHINKNIILSFGQGVGFFIGYYIFFILLNIIISEDLIKERKSMGYLEDKKFNLQ